MANRMHFKPGYIRDWMPSIPNNTVTDGDAEKRWQKRGAAIEAKALKHLEGGANGVSAESLASALGEDVTVTAAVLAHMREEVDCRLRVTRGGRLLHDFSGDQIAKLKSKKRQTLPARFGIFVLSIFANIGAAWPIVLSIAIATGALAGMAIFPDPLTIGVAGIASVVGVIIANIVLGWLFHAFLTPWMSGPKLGSVEAEDTNALEDATAREYLSSSSSSDWGWDSGGSWGSSSSSNRGCVFVDLGDVDDARALLVIIVAAVLIAIIVAFTAAIGLWLRGLWRAALRLGVPDLITSPTSWIRGSKPVDRFEKWLPTNDLVIRVTRSLRRLLKRSHPEDGGMVQRIMSEARINGGRISALEIQMAEGVDANEANTIGAELTSWLEGRIDVTDDGELDFVFPEKALYAEFARPAADRNAEYITFENKEIQRRKRQNYRNVPVNIPGINYGHLVGTDRLVAGTLIMCLSAMALVHLYPDISLFWQIGVDFLFPMMTIGAFSLSGAARYASVSMAKHGVFRDVRRAGFHAIAEAQKAGKPTVNFTNLADELRTAFRGAYKKISYKDILEELDAVAMDLDLELDMNSAGASVYDIQSIGQRMDALKTYRQDVVFDFEVPVENEDEVVFDSHVEHDQVHAF